MVEELVPNGKLISGNQTWIDLPDGEVATDWVAETLLFYSSGWQIESSGPALGIILKTVITVPATEETLAIARVLIGLSGDMKFADGFTTFTGPVGTRYYLVSGVVATSIPGSGSYQPLGSKVTDNTIRLDPEETITISTGGSGLAVVKTIIPLMLSYKDIPDTAPIYLGLNGSSSLVAADVSFPVPNFNRANDNSFASSITIEAITVISHKDTPADTSATVQVYLPDFFATVDPIAGHIISSTRRTSGTAADIPFTYSTQGMCLLYTPTGAIGDASFAITITLVQTIQLIGDE